MQGQPGQSGPMFEYGESELVDDRGCKPGQRKPECAFVKDRNTNEGDTEENKFNGYAHEAKLLRSSWPSLAGSPHRKRRGRASLCGMSRELAIPDSETTRSMEFSVLHN